MVRSLGVVRYWVIVSTFQDEWAFARKLWKSFPADTEAEWCVWSSWPEQLRNRENDIVSSITNRSANDSDVRICGQCFAWTWMLMVHIGDFQSARRSNSLQYTALLTVTIRNLLETVASIERYLEQSFIKGHTINLLFQTPTFTICAEFWVAMAILYVQLHSQYEAQMYSLHISSRLFGTQDLGFWPVWAFAWRYEVRNSNFNQLFVQNCACGAKYSYFRGGTLSGSARGTFRISFWNIYRKCRVLVLLLWNQTQKHDPDWRNLWFTPVLLEGFSSPWAVALLSGNMGKPLLIASSGFS